MPKKAKEAFPKIKKIGFEGPDSKNPLAFKHYDENEIIDGKSMKDHLRFSVVYWHTFRNPLSDPFGAGTALRPWDDGTDSVKNAQNRARVAFEFMGKLGAPYYAFHDRDVAPEGKSLSSSNKNLDAVAKVLAEEQKRTGIKLLWGTACLLRIPVTCTERPQAAMPTYLPMPVLRLRKPLKSLNLLVVKGILSGEAEKVTQHFGIQI